jgi:hypothetical protein
MPEVQERVGDVPVERILLFPSPGTATVLDVLDPDITRGRGVELVDGILLEKPMGAEEDAIGMWLALHLFNFTAGQNLGRFLGAQGGSGSATGWCGSPTCRSSAGTAWTTRARSTPSPARSCMSRQTWWWRC